MGITANATGEGPCSFVTAAILAIAVGVAPMAEPMYPAVITAASKFLPKALKIIKTENNRIATVWTTILTIIKRASLSISQNLSDIMAIARNNPRLKSETMAKVGEFAGHFIFGIINGTRLDSSTPPSMQVANKGNVKWIYSRKSLRYIPMPIENASIRRIFRAEL